MLLLKLNNQIFSLKFIYYKYNPIDFYQLNIKNWTIKIFKFYLFDIYLCLILIKKMKNFLLSTILIFSVFLNANTEPNDFEALKQLEGKWIGTLERTNDTTDSFILEFSIASNGSAIL